MVIPDFIIHYSRGEPFRSISSVAQEMLPHVLKELNEVNTWGLSRFSDSEYLKRRMVVEHAIRKEFIAKGGAPILTHPIYCFLGRNTHFEEHERNVGYLIHLKDLPIGFVSFTYGDSMFSLNEDYRQQKGKAYLSELCPRVYRLDELLQIFSHADYQADTRLHIEAQLWITPTDSMYSRCE